MKSGTFAWLLAALSTVLLLPHSVVSVSQFCTPEQDFCATGGSDTLGNIIVTVHAAAAGYAAFGIGSSMYNATIFVGFRNSTGGITLSPRTSEEHGLPLYAPQIVASLVDVQQVAAPLWAKLSYTFQHPAAGITSNTTYIYAWSESPPSSPDSPSSGFGYHYSRGIIQGLDLTSPALLSAVDNHTIASKTADGFHQSVPVGVASKASLSMSEGRPQPMWDLPEGVGYDTILRLHGVIMVMAWTICPAFGIFIARYLKETLGVMWFRLHVFFMVVGTGILTIGGIALVYMHKPPPHFQDSPHRAFGIIVGFSMLAQMALGVVCDRMFNPERTSVPWWDKAHWVFGRALVIGAVLNIFGGVTLYQSMGYEIHQSIRATFAILFTVLVAAFAYGEYKFGQTSHRQTTYAQEEQGKGSYHVMP
ncbi:hypothetical protein BC831DRAFT_475434 [Entophlyctis helioformis]|nr:hypothetical protein BC831DRAFT_475434 [Entophlyctis helioformis]